MLLALFTVINVSWPLRRVGLHCQVVEQFQMRRADVTAPFHNVLSDPLRQGGKRQNTRQQLVIEMSRWPIREL